HQENVAWLKYNGWQPRPEERQAKNAGMAQQARTKAMTHEGKPRSSWFAPKRAPAVRALKRAAEQELARVGPTHRRAQTSAALRENYGSSIDRGMDQQSW